MSESYQPQPACRSQISDTRRRTWKTNENYFQKRCVIDSPDCTASIRLTAMKQRRQRQLTKSMQITANSHVTDKQRRNAISHTRLISRHPAESKCNKKGTTVKRGPQAAKPMAAFRFALAGRRLRQLQLANKTLTIVSFCLLRQFGFVDVILSVRHLRSSLVSTDVTG